MVSTYKYKEFKNILFQNFVFRPLNCVFTSISFINDVRLFGVGDQAFFSWDLTKILNK